jgi:hypothetical protein
MSDSPVETVEPVAPNLDDEPEIDYDALVTEDGKPVDNLYVEKLYRLLTRPLYASWPGPGVGRTFLVMVDVGWFYQAKTPAVAPDCLLSLDVTCPKDLHVKQGHSYYQWLMGKQPDVVIECVSDRTGGEETHKKKLYARLGVPHYAVFDPDHRLSVDTLRTYELVAGTYRLGDAGPWANVGLGLCLWQGTFEGVEETWLRWCDANGTIIPTGEERAAQLAEQARQATEQARQAEMRTAAAVEQAREANERIRQLEAELQRLKGEPPA